MRTCVLTCGSTTEGWRVVLFLLAVSCFGVLVPAPAESPPQTEEDAQREAALAEFTRRMKEANYPALFEKAAAEFNVPADVPKGVAFAETRWEHLTWPPGEVASPETGMPRPYGIMSLWSNEFFGYSLVTAAKLIGKDPEELKADPFQNMRGAAALLRKLYEETPKPAGTTEQDIESWRYAIAEYCGIPEPDLKHRHALSVFEFMNQGYHQFGIEWPGRPVNLEPMREEVRRIVTEERRKEEARLQAGELLAGAPNVPVVEPQALSSQAEVQPNPPVTTASGQIGAAPPAAPVTQTERRSWWLAATLLALLVGGLLAYRQTSKATTQNLK